MPKCRLSFPPQHGPFDRTCRLSIDFNPIWLRPRIMLTKCIHCNYINKMDALLENYIKLVQEYDKDLVESLMQFSRNIEACQTFHHNRAKKVVNAAEVLLRGTKKMKPKKTIPEIPKPPLTVHTWWELFVQERFPNEKCMENFKCSRRTYFFLIRTLRPHIRPRLGATPQRRALNMVKGVSVEKQVAIMLHKLAKCEDYCVVSGMFGIHKSTVHKVFYKAIKGINKHLLHKLIKMPKEEEIEDFVKQFEESHKIPQVMAAIESTHIPIYPSAHMVPTFTNSKDYTSFIAQMIVDPHYCFRDVSVRHPGNTEDQVVLEDSNIYKYAEHVIPRTNRKINGTKVPYKIVGSTAYPLLPWLVTGYKLPATQTEILFNEYINDIRKMADIAMARLKARFIILSRSIDVSFKLAPQIIAACCTLHNICERNGDEFLEVWLTESKKLLEKYPQPEKIEDLRDTLDVAQNQRDTMRDFLENHILLDNNSFSYIDRENVSLLAEEIV